MTPEERAARAVEIRELVRDGVFGEMMDEIERQFIAEWKVAATDRERENCWYAVKVLTLLRQKVGAQSSEINMKGHDVAEIRRVGVSKTYY
jgi:hypothetical protein